MVAATLTDEQYRAVEHEHFVAPKGLRELGGEAHWVLDGLPPEGREVMLSVVPPVPRSSCCTASPGAIAGPQSDGGATARPRTCRHCRCRR